MPFSINTFRSAGLPLGGARPSLFEVVIPRLGPQIVFRCKAAQIPAGTVAPLEVPYFGRTIKRAGFRTFAEWTPTIIEDEDFVVRRLLESWNQEINSHEGNLRTGGQDYKGGDAFVTVYSKSGPPIKIYKLNNLWCSEVGAIDLAWDNDAVMEYSVTFQFDYWENVL